VGIVAGMKKRSSLPFIPPRLACRPYVGVFIFVVLCASGCAGLLRPKLKQELVEIKTGDYVLDKDHAVILFKVDHMGFSKFVGRFNEFDASLRFVPERVEESTLEAVVNMRSVDVNNAKFERALNGRFWFDTKTYPQAYFKTTSAELVGPQRVRFFGNLTFLGVTAPLELTVNVAGAANNLLSGKYTIGFSAEAVFSRSTFGLDRYVPTVGDDIELEIHAEFQRR